MKSDNFQAAAFDVNATEFKYDNRERKLKLALAALVGGMIGVIYVRLQARCAAERALMRVRTELPVTSLCMTPVSRSTIFSTSF